MRYIVQIRRPQTVRGAAESLGLMRFGAKGFHDLLAADGLLQDFVQFGGVVLRFSSRPANAPAQPHCWHQHDRQHRDTHQRKPPIVLQQDVYQADDDEGLPQPVGQHAGRGHLNLLDVAHHGRHDPAGGLRFEKLGVLAQHFIEDRLADVRYG